MTELEDVEMGILRILAENSEWNLRARTIKRMVENVMQFTRLDARDYGGKLRVLEKDGLVEPDDGSHPAKWRITKEGLRKLKELQEPYKEEKINK